MDDLNERQWQGRDHKGHYEGWYVTVVDPNTKTAFWFRYTLYSGHDGDAHASLWAFTFGLPGGDIEGRDEYPISVFDDSKGLKLGPASLTDKGAKGELGEGARRINWDLKFTPSRLSWQHFSPGLYKLGLSKTCVNSRSLDMDVSGQITVGEQVIKLNQWPGEQSHIWGRRPTALYAWAHCNAFDVPGVVFEGVNAKIQKGPLSLPWGGPLLFVREGERFEIRKFFEMFGVSSKQRYGLWEFEAQSGSSLISGQVRVPATAVVAVEYQDPSGGPEVYCHNSLLAEMDVVEYQKKGGRWQKLKSYHSSQTTAFEITRPRPDPAVSRVLRLSDARRLKG